MGENDIMVCVVVKPRFLEDVCLELRADSPLTEFMLDTLRQMENGVLASSLMNAAKSPSLEHPSAPTPRAAARFTPPPGSASPPTLFRYFFKACV